MSRMPEVGDAQFDVVIAFDVLEHVPDYQRALDEILRILKPYGSAILMIPQKDDLKTTYEDPAIVTEQERLAHFGQRDHLRIFGDDFSEVVEKHGFFVRAVDESCFSNELISRYVLFPPRLSSHPLATNHRKVFVCENCLVLAVQNRLARRIPGSTVFARTVRSRSQALPGRAQRQGVQQFGAICGHAVLPVGEFELTG